MLGTAAKLFSDERGFIVSIELILITTILVLGLVAGLAAVRDAMVSEMTDIAGAIQNLNQSYSVNGIRGSAGRIAGSDYVDAADVPARVTHSTDACVEFYQVGN